MHLQAKNLTRRVTFEFEKPVRSICARRNVFSLPSDGQCDIDSDARMTVRGDSELDVAMSRSLRPRWHRVVCNSYCLAVPKEKPKKGHSVFGALRALPSETVKGDPCAPRAL